MRNRLRALCVTRDVRVQSQTRPDLTLPDLTRHPETRAVGIDQLSTGGGSW